MSAFTVRALIRKEQYPENQNGNTWEGSDVAGGIEPLNSGEPSLSGVAAAPSPSKGNNPALPEEIIMASPEVLAL